jgi:cell division protein ZapE
MSILLQKYTELADSGVIKQDQIQEQAVEKLQQLLESVQSYEGTRQQGWFSRLISSKPPLPRGLYIYGDVGRGKSMLMDLFFGTLKVQKKARVHFHEFMQRIHTDLHHARQKNIPEPLAHVLDTFTQKTHVLCLDEIQVTDITDAMLVGRVFDGLHARNVVIVATSNRVPEDLYKDGLNRHLFLPFIALIRERLDIYCLDGLQDYRRQHTDMMDVYFTPLEYETQQVMDAKWQALTQSHPIQAQTIDVKGRTVTFPNSANGCTRLTFAELCDTALGAADYIGLAQTFHTLMLDNIPVLSPENANAAKRFVTLIDTLYENQCVLICSAARPPDYLYPSGKGAFEFQRTASRLHEMQSRGYLEGSRAALKF